ncbi:MAG: nucleotidyltransferase domain-containing protein [Candidatus Bathyarchaeia archaeon]|nr:nucleotidyltransferase domain-containing protein [Candidatus Bathyarchaeota archaeon]MDI6905698.1 nucleotidyltransferase domain-containing protein [Candidatus Bathyarchaeia archaeon]
MLKELEKIVEKARKDKNVLAVIVFGSHARKESKPFSDVDLCIVLQPKKFDNLFMTNKRLEYLDLVPDKYDIQIFQQLPVFIRTRILRDGKLLLNKDYDTMFRVALNTIKEFDLFRKHYYYCIESVAYGR